MLYTLIQWTWGFLQTFLGAILYVLYRKYPHFRYHHAMVTVWNKPSSVSLGWFIFIEDRYPKELLAHEYGHTIQSLVLGPLYLPIIGIPSLIWFHIHKPSKGSYYSFYPEKTANALVKRYTDEDIFED